MAVISREAIKQSRRVLKAISNLITFFRNFKWIIAGFANFQLRLKKYVKAIVHKKLFVKKNLLCFT